MEYHWEFMWDCGPHPRTGWINRGLLSQGRRTIKPGQEWRSLRCFPLMQKVRERKLNLNKTTDSSSHPTHRTPLGWQKNLKTSNMSASGAEQWELSCTGRTLWKTICSYQGKLKICWSSNSTWRCRYSEGNTWLRIFTAALVSPKVKQLTYSLTKDGESTGRRILCSNEKNEPDYRQQDKWALLLTLCFVKAGSNVPHDSVYRML